MNTMKSFKQWLSALIIVASISSFALVASPTTTLAANSTQSPAASSSCESRLLTLPPWFRGVVDTDCNIVSPAEVGGLSSFIMMIAMNIVEIILHIVGYVAIGFVIYGGFLYLTSTGSPDRVKAGQATLTNALVGLLISTLAIAIVNVVVGIF